jgi:hypothetical protein
MPTLTPQITLTVTLLDFSGAKIGTATQPAYLRISLAGYGQKLPCVPGTGNIARVVSWFSDIPVTGAQVSVKLWGNDVIVPAGTYYCIAVLDASKNVLQSGIYQFTGTLTIDLSDAAQIVQPSPQLAGIRNYEFEATGTGTTIALPYTPIPGTPVLPFRGGILLSESAGDYSVAGNIVTFAAGYESGDVIRVIYWTSTF